MEIIKSKILLILLLLSCIGNKEEILNEPKKVVLTKKQLEYDGNAYVVTNKMKIYKEMNETTEVKEEPTEVGYSFYIWKEVLSNVNSKDGEKWIYGRFLNHNHASQGLLVWTKKKYLGIIAEKREFDLNFIKGQWRFQQPGTAYIDDYEFDIKTGIAYYFTNNKCYVKDNEYGCTGDFGTAMFGGKFIVEDNGIKGHFDRLYKKGRNSKFDKFTNTIPFHYYICGDEAMCNGGVAIWRIPTIPDPK